MQETKEIRYLRAARGAISSGELKDAMSLYAMAFEENPENPEAKYFCEFTNFIDGFGTSEDVRYPFLYVINSLEYAVKYVAEFDCSNYEKSVVITMITSTYNILFDYLLKANDILGVDLIDDFIIGLYWLGSYINDDFQEISDIMEFAAEPWEKAIELHLKYGCNHANYKIEDYAEKLKKIKPEYVVPEKPLETIREQKAREEAEKKAKKEAEAKARAQMEAEEKAREEAERAEQKAHEDAEKEKAIFKKSSTGSTYIDIDNLVLKIKDIINKLFNKSN